MKLSYVKELVRLLEESSLTLLEIEEEGCKLRLEKAGPAQTSHAFAPTQPAQASVPAQGVVEMPVGGVDFNRLKEIKSPMVGVFYESPAPGAEPFVRPGSVVKKGDVLCVLEAMKLMNEITAEYDGEIIDVCVSNGDVVEYSQTLFKLSPA